jgi:O-acetyl-ADP-ribose deacetylase (regulator of RNase III)
VDTAVEIAVRETVAELRRDEEIEKVIFACFDAEVYAAYRRAVRGPA